MTFRARLLLGFGAVVLVPLTVFGLRIRVVMANRLTAEYQQRVAALVSVIRADLDQRSAGTALRLARSARRQPAPKALRGVLVVSTGGDGARTAYAVDTASSPEALGEEGGPVWQAILLALLGGVLLNLMPCVLPVLSL